MILQLLLSNLLLHRQRLLANKPWGLYINQQANQVHLAGQDHYRLYGIILRWVEQKGIQVENKKSFAYLVARKIDRDGVKVPNQFNSGGLVSNVITDEKILGFTKRLTTYFLESARSEVIKTWQLQG